jgi:predicted DCC family thiol-disulfide oxidoreductase YuxK
MNNLKNKSIVLFDGVCNLCNSSVNFIIKHDSNEHYLFASLQSDVAKDILLQFDLKKYNLNTILLFENGFIYDRSTAVLKIMKRLDKGYPILYFFIIIPKKIRDWVYDVIAKNRYKWFGRKDTCMIPKNTIKKRFL